MGPYMEIIKCDKCKKIIRPRKADKTIKKVSGSIRDINPAEWISFDLCEKCSKPLIKFIKNYLPR